MYGANPSQQGIMNGGGPARGPYQPVRVPQNMQAMNPMQQGQMRGMHQGGMSSHPRQMYGNPGSNPYPGGVMSSSHFPTSSAQHNFGMQRSGMSMPDGSGMKTNSMPGMQQHPQYPGGDYGHMSRPTYSGQPTMSYSTNSMQHMQRPPSQGGMYGGPGYGGVQAGGQMSHMPSGGATMNASNKGEMPSQQMPSNMPSYSSMQQSLPQKQQLPTVATGSYMQRSASMHGDNSKQPGYYSRLPNSNQQAGYPSGYPNSMAESTQRMSHPPGGMVRMQPPSGSHSSGQMHSGYPGHQTQHRFDAQPHQSQYLGSNHPIPQTVSPRQNIPSASPHLQSPALPQSPAAGSNSMSRSRIPSQQGGQTSMPMRSPRPYDNKGPMSPRMNYPNQSPRYQNTANYNQISQSPNVNANATPTPNSYGGRFLSPNSGVNTTMSGVPAHQSAQSNMKPYGGNPMQMQHMSSNATGGQPQYPGARMPDMQGGYPPNQWGPRRPSPMQSPPNMMQNQPMQPPLSSPQNNQMAPPKSSSSIVSGPPVPTNISTKPLQDPSLVNTDFSLDSLLSDPMDAGGSFMQQLQDINSNNASVNNSNIASNKPIETPVQNQQLQSNDQLTAPAQQGQMGISTSQIIPMPSATVSTNQQSRPTVNNVAQNQNVSMMNENVPPPNKVSEEDNKSNMSIPTPHRLPTLENMNFNNLDAISNKQDIPPISQPTYSSAPISSSLNNAFTTTSTTATSNITATETTEGESASTTQSVFTPVTSTIPVQSTASTQPLQPTNEAPSKTPEMMSPENKPVPRFSSPPQTVTSLSAESSVLPSPAVPTSSQTSMAPPTSNFPPKPQQEFYNEASPNVAANPPINQQVPPGSAAPFPAPAPGMGSPPHQQVHYSNSTTVPGKPPPNSIAVPPHPQAQVNMQNRMAHPMQQGPNYRPTGPMDPRMPNQMPPHGQPPGYRHMGPQPGMPPNAAYPQQHPHGPPGQPGPRPYPYPRPPYNPNMPPQMNYMPRPGVMRHEMGGPMPYGPQGMPPHIQQQHQHLQMLERDIHNFQMQLRTEQNPARVEEINRRLVELENRRHHIINQLRQSHGGPMPGIELKSPPVGVMPPNAEEMSSAKKKRARQKKELKMGEDGELKDKPPKKKKKKELIPGAQKPKKKKKSDKEEGDDAAYMPMISEAGSDSSMPFSQPVEQQTAEPVDAVEDPTYTLPMKRKKKPPATTIKPNKKKKRKRGEESDEEHSIKVTPPPSPEDSYIEKRRSSRNVKRKRYTESIELQLSDDGIEPEEGELLKQQQQAVKQDTGTDEDQLVVDKILAMRTRKVPIFKSPKKDANPIKNAQTNEEEKATKLESTEGNENTVTPTSPSADNNKSNEIASTDTVSTINKEHTVPEHQNKHPEPEIVGYNEDEEFLIKFKNFSYLHCEWKTLKEIGDKRADAKIKRYKTKQAQMNDFLQYENEEPFNPDFTVVDRVLDVSSHLEDGKMVKHYLVKWCSLPYEESTWESEESVDNIKIREFEMRCSYRPPDMKMMVPPKHMWHKLTLQDSYFKNDNQLRDYQLEGISWLLFNWYNRRNCILADEMGLGKTIQSITFLQKIFDHGIQGPFLVVAPLSTIANWQREFESWTGINAVVYHGSQTSRDMINTYEFYCRDENLDEIPGCYKLHAVITTYEMIVLENSHLANIDWRCLIIDEAHRLKNRTCKLSDSLNQMNLEFKVLLTGTPLQNNIEELFSLLNFLQPDTFNSEQAFSLEFGTLTDNSQVEKLQELLKPMMLRRLKEDVEKSIAPKEETIIEVELTNIQKKYYRAILERNFEFLSKGTSSGNVPNLMNTMMELRKCCNHPYLIKGAEDKIQAEYLAEHPDDFNALQVMIQSAGKLVLIDKLLPKLKANGHKVLIFSQMVKCLDILEDYLMQNQYFYERIDGCVRGNDRQMAIDRFSRPGSDRFVFLLCTRAGGLGINLTAADTVIIFDSDWNPQNDLQAQARCHRIGQQKSVKVYRLITRNSYEREMFDKASMKLGLDKAVLQSISGRQDQTLAQQPALSKHEVEDLLKRGAYGAIMDDDDAANKFCEEDIDSILKRRAHTITIESEKGSTFSKASFVSAEDRTDISLDDPNFWEKWAKKADLDLDRMTNNKLIIEQPRRRKQTRRFGGMTADDDVLAEIGSESDSDYEDRPNTRTKKNKSNKSMWSRRDCFRVIKSLLTFGWGRWKITLEKCGFPTYVMEQDLEEICRVVLIYCLKFYNGDEKIKLFIWDLITPAGHASINGIDFKNHEGLSAPVPRGRKGRKAKEDPDRKQQMEERDWAKDIKVDAILQDDGFKKHLQHQCNKVLLRIRTLYYLRTEILGPYGTSIEEGAPAKSLDIEIPEKVGDPLTAWWDAECDKSLLIGVYKHGYEKYNLIRADPTLCFLEKVGRPDEKAIAAELEVDNDGDAGADPEYKPAKVVFNDYSEFEDSPTPNTPNTEPASPADNEFVKKSDDKDISKSESVKDKLSSLAADWPPISDLNMRMRRLITCFQKHYKLMQARMMNLERRNMRRDRMSDSPRYRKEFQARWTRREETDFYRTISTFGVEYNDKGNLSWSRFRNIAKLDRKSDDSLRMYYLAFTGMCERVCGRKNPAPIPKEALNIQIDPITEERASRTLYRLHILDKIRKDVLRNKHFNERMEKCQPSPDLPVWWVPIKHDKELLLGMDRHGLTRTDIHILNDPTLSFLQAMRDFESKPLKEQTLLLNMQQHGSEISERINNAAKIDVNDLEKATVKEEAEESKQKDKEEEEVKKEVNSPEEKADAEEETPKNKPDTESNDVAVEDDKPASIPENVENKTNGETNEIATEDSKIAEEKETKENNNEISNHLENNKEIIEKMETEEIDTKQDNKSSPVKESIPEENIEAETDKSKEDVANVEEKVENDDKERSPEAEEKDAQVNEEKEKTTSEEEKPTKEAAEVKQEEAVEEEKSTEKQPEKYEDKPAKADKIETPETKEETEKEVKTSEDKIKNEINPPLPASSSDPLFLQQPLSIKWPKDRILVQRVEHVCHLVINGEWPTPKESRELNQTPTMFAESAASSPMGGSTPRGMDSPRQSPIPSKMHHSASAGALTAADLASLNPLMMSENELIAAMLQMQQATKPSYSGSSRSRGRRKKKHNYQSISPTRGQNSRLAQAAEQHAKDQQELQRRLEEMYLLNSFAHSQASSSSKGHKSSDKDFFPDLNTIKQSMLKGSSKEDLSLGNSSASLLAKLQELATSKPEKEVSQEQLLREAQKQAKDSKSRSSDYRSVSSSKHSQHQALDNPFQLPPELLASFPFNQLLQDSLKSGNPNNLFPLLMDPNFILNESAKLLQQQTQSQSSSSSKLTPPAMSQADMNKLFQSMPDLAALGLFPPGLFPQFPTSMQKPSSSTKKLDKAEKSSRSKDTLSSKIQSLEMANEQALQSLSKEFLDKHIKKDSKLESEKTSPNSSSTSLQESSKVPGKSPARKASKLDAMFGGISSGKVAESSQKQSSSGRSKKSKKSKFGFISPAVLPQDIRIPVHHSAEGKRLSGEDAPLNKDLADWLKQNPGFVVDYQVLRQQLDESNDQASSENKEEKPSESSKQEKNEPRQDSPTLSIESESSSRISTKSPSLKHKHKSSSRSSTPAQNRTQTPSKSSALSPSLKQSEAALFAANNPFANLPPNLMNSFQGLPPDFAALVASGLMPGLPGMPFPKLPGQEIDFNQSSSSSSHKSSRSSQKESSRRKEKSDKEYYRSKEREDKYSDKQKDGRQSSSNFPSQEALAADAFAAALGAGMVPGAGGLMSDPLQLMAAMQASGMQMDPKALATAGLPMLPFLGGMPGANPLFPGFMSPEAAAAAMEGLPGASSSKRESSDHSSNSDSKKYSSQKESGGKSSSSKSSSSVKSSYPTSMASDPFSEALMAMQMSGGSMASLAGNPFLHPQAAGMMMPPMMGMNNMAMPDMFSTEALLQAQLAALGGAGGLPFPMDLKPPSSSSSSKKTGSNTPHSSSSSKSEGRHSSKSKEDGKTSSGKGEEEPMDLTQH